MSPVLPKHQMSEEDIKLQYITPSITSKWSRDKITMETRITDGKINLKGNFVFREKPKRADYILYLNANNPIAVVEAKDNTHSVSHGLPQAMTYAKMLDGPLRTVLTVTALLNMIFLLDRNENLVWMNSQQNRNLLPDISRNPA